jgi:segregation and condensation protein B
MEIGHIIPHIEALIFASDRPLTPVDITELINNAFGFMEDKITMEQVETSIEGIKEKYLSEFYPFELRESGGGWQFLTKKEFHKTVAQLNGEKFLKRLSNAALETLAIIAYKQPITKADIESIRGVSCDYSIQKLLEKELIVITGRNEELPGKPLVYATSKNFMDYFGLNSPEDLPKLKEVFEEAMVNPTTMTNEGTVPETEETDLNSDENGSALVVTENGELLEEATDQDTDTEANVEQAESESDDLPTEETENLPEESIEVNEIDNQQSSEVKTDDEEYDKNADAPSEEDENNPSAKSDKDPESPDQGTSV